MIFSRILQFGLLVLVASLFLPNCNAITKEQRETITKGIQAGKEFTGVLSKTKNFVDVLKKFGSTIGPWVKGIGMFGQLLGAFLPEENVMLEEMKKGFEEVNKRLDAIKDEITAVKEAIDWATVKVKFVDIETSIRLLDQKLKEVHLANNPAHGKVEYVRVYEGHYNEAGLKLFDAIVHNDQVFSENILTAGMRYTDYTRSMNNDFMKGLIALMMKSSNIEISYEKFKEHDRSMEMVWELRLKQCHEAMTKADKVLQDAWAHLFKGEVNKMAKDLKGTNHNNFRDAVYKFLSEKYSWRYWFVLSYDTCRGWNNHAIRGFPTETHIQFSFHGRNLVVVTSHSSRRFDVNKANSYSKRDWQCPSSSTSDCSKNGARHLANTAPFYGVSQAAISSRCGWAMKGAGGRVSWGTSYLRKGSWSSKYTLFYFG